MLPPLSEGSTVQEGCCLSTPVETAPKPRGPILPFGQVRNAFFRQAMSFSNELQEISNRLPAGDCDVAGRTSGTFPASRPSHPGIQRNLNPGCT
jgi:hypothetical protein